MLYVGDEFHCIHVFVYLQMYIIKYERVYMHVCLIYLIATSPRKLVKLINGQAILVTSPDNK